MTELRTEQGVVSVPAGMWKADPAHSSVAFEVKHLMIATVRGHFSSFDGTLDADEDPERSHAYGWVDAASIDTGSAERDAHLRSADFFDVERHPRIAFDSTRVKWADGGTYRVWGNLTIKDVTREVEVQATVQGVAVDPWGVERVGVAVRGSIDRTEFGLTWQHALASGGLLVGEEVELLLDVSAVRA